MKTILVSLLLIAGSTAHYTFTNNCPTAIDMIIGEDPPTSIAKGASVFKDTIGTGYFARLSYTTTRSTPGLNGALATARAGFYFLPDYWYYYIVRDLNPYLFNTGITIAPDQPVSADGNFCKPASCLDGRCSTAFNWVLDFGDGPPAPDSIPQEPYFQCKVPGTNFNITFCPTGDWPAPKGALLTEGLFFKQKCVDVRGNEQANGTPVQVYDCNNTGAQRWFVKPGSTKVQLEDTNFCLDAGTNPTNGTQMKIWQCYDNLPAQQWNLRNDGRLELEGTGLCLDLTDADPTNGRPLQVWGCSQYTSNQFWTAIDTI